MVAALCVLALPRRIKLLSLSLSLLAGNAYAAGDAARARELFTTCAQCHGQRAEGVKSNGAPAIAGQHSWYLAAQLKKFRDGVRGKHPKDVAGMRMRPMARTLPNDADVQLIADYIAALPAATPTPTVSGGNAATGKDRFQVCAACHGVNGDGQQATNAPALNLTNDWYLLTQISNFQHGIRGGDPAADAIAASMAPMAKLLDEQGSKDIAAFLATAPRASATVAP